MVKVKICGITTLKDAVNAVNAGADFLGFNFYKKSPRYISLSKAEAIIQKLKGRVKTAGVFVNEDIDTVNLAAGKLGLDLVQLHGDESPSYCLKVRKPVIKAIRVSSKQDLKGLGRFRVRYFLFDSFSKGLFGGTGKGFDTKVLRGYKGKRPFFLAGGLSPDNAAKAVHEVRPFAVDACSGVESAPGRKLKSKMEKLIAIAKAGGIMDSKDRK